MTDTQRLASAPQGSNCAHRPPPRVNRTPLLPPAQVREQLQLVTDELPLPLHEKLAFLQEARHAFGRTALMLSGGGTHGSFHLGVRGG